MNRLFNASCFACGFSLSGATLAIWVSSDFSHLKYRLRRMYERLDDTVRDIASGLDWRFYSVPRSRRSNSPFAVVCGDFANIALRDGDTRSLKLRLHRIAGIRDVRDCTELCAARDIQRGREQQVSESVLILGRDAPGSAPPG